MDMVIKPITKMNKTEYIKCIEFSYMPETILDFSIYICKFVNQLIQQYMITNNSSYSNMYDRLTTTIISRLIWMCIDNKEITNWNDIVKVEMMEYLRAFINKMSILYPLYFDLVNDHNENVRYIIDSRKKYIEYIDIKKKKIEQYNLSVIKLSDILCKHNDLFEWGMILFGPREKVKPEYRCYD